MADVMIHIPLRGVIQEFLNREYCYCQYMLFT